MKYFITFIQLFVIIINNYTQPNARFEEVKAQNTLTQNSVVSMYQDNLGFLWIGTTLGLNKFDGYKYKSYMLNKIESNELGSNRILSIKADLHERLWIETYDGKIYRFNPETEHIKNFKLKTETIITSIHFSEDSLVWFSTNNSGVYCIKEINNQDNLFIKHFVNNENADDIISDNQVNLILSDQFNNIWFGGKTGLNQIIKKSLFDSVLINQYFTDSNIQFTTACSFNDFIVFGTEKSGVLIYNTNTGLFSLDSLLTRDRINIIQSDQNNLWIGTDKGTLILFNNNLTEKNIFHLTDKRSGKFINTIYKSSKNELWILTRNFGITKFSLDSRSFKYYELTPVEKQKMTDNERTIILEDQNHNIWLCVQNMGIAYYNGDADIFNFYSNDPLNSSSLISDVTQSIIQDRDGVFWIGTAWYGTGLNKMYILDEALNYIQPTKKPINKLQNFVRSALEDSKGNLWIGTKNGEVLVYDQNYNLLQNFEQDITNNYSGHNVYSIFEDSKGFIWLCTKGSGIYKSKISLKQIKNYSNLPFELFIHDPENRNSISNNNIYDITEDYMGRYWIASYGGGMDLLEIYDDQYTFRNFNTQNSNLTSDKLRDLYITSDNILWIATTYGLNYIQLPTDSDFEIKNNFNWKHINQNISYSDILMITEDKEKNLWISTPGGGINSIHRKKDSTIIKHYTSVQGLKNNVTFSIVPDQNGDLWIGTESGLTKLIVKENKFVNIDENNGLPVTLFSERTGFMDSKNRLVFGTVDGFYIIHPDKVKNKIQDYPIIFTDFQLFNKEVKPEDPGSPLKKSISYTKRIILNHDQTAFTIEFSALSYKSADYNNFAFKLDGYDNDWNFVGSENKAAYKNIPYGDYTFRVRNTNGSSLVAQNEARLKIKILPPFWLSYKAFIIYIISFLITTYITIKIVLRFYRLKNNIKIERQVAESKLRFFTNISHEIRTPLTLIMGPLENIIERKDINNEVKQQLNVIERNARRLLRMVNQILDFRKVQNEKMDIKITKFNIYQLTELAFKNFEMLAKQKNITYNLSSNNKLLNVYADYSQIEAVIFNLLSNAFKFTPEFQTIGVNVNDIIDSEYIEITVSDTGVGIEEDKLPKIFDRFFVSHTESSEKYYGSGIGLSLSQEYIKLHKGEINVYSNLGKGTTFSIRLRKGKDHFSDLEIESSDKTINIEYAKDLDTFKTDLTNETTAVQENLPLVLIVEDDPDMIVYITNLVSKHYKVIQANNGVDGIKKAKSEIPDLVICDIMMPGKTGYELSKELKNDFNTSHIPLIFLTAKTETEDRVEGFDSGAEAYISKPFNDKVLLSQINSIITQRKNVMSRYGDTIELKPDEIKVESKDKIFIEKVIYLIEQKLEEPGFNVEKLVDELNISRTLFYKKITSITGYKPVELLRLIRLKRAYQLIESGEYNISEVAYMVGFNDIRYFSTCFKKEFGTSPSNISKGKK